MSGSNGGLLGVGGIGGVEEVAPTINPDVDTSKTPRRRNIKPRGLDSNRISRRQFGNNVVVEDIGFSSKSRNLKSLTIKGGYTGQIRVTESKIWEYFPYSNN